MTANKFTDQNVDINDIFYQTAIEMGLSQPGIIEKDYWLVQTLDALFNQLNGDGIYVFKGGTSLSKCFKLIERFSEDVDITVSRKSLGYFESDEEVRQMGSTRRKKYFEKLEAGLTDHAKELASKLNKLFCSQGESEDLFFHQDKGVVIFEYPQINPKANMQQYIRPRIVIELGCRGDMQPSVICEVKNYIEEVFPALYKDSGTSAVCVHALSQERTFWEKVTLLHMLANQGQDKVIAPRMSRHYYDVYKLIKNNVANAALSDVSLLGKVARHKGIFFKSKQASYETAIPGGLKLIPIDLTQIKNDYSLMSEMIFRDTPEFNEIISSILDLEKTINNM